MSNHRMSSLQLKWGWVKDSATGHGPRIGKFDEGRAAMRYKLVFVFAACVLTTGLATMLHAARDKAGSDSSKPRDAAAPLIADEPAERLRRQAGGHREIPPEEMNPKEFILPFDKPYFSPEEVKRIMEEPGVKFIRRGPKGSQFYDVGFMIEPYPKWTFSVSVMLDGKPTPRQVKLAEEAKRLLSLDQPENPGRSRSFPKWRMVQKDPDVPGVPLVHTGWALMIRSVEPVTGGWRARVEVHPLARTEDYRTAIISNCHVEVYSHVNGSLHLDDEFPDPSPFADPEAGMSGILRG